MIDVTDFIAGDPSLDFVNTIGGIRSGVHNDTLASYADLLDWSRAQNLLTALMRHRLATLANQDPRVAERALARAKDLREAFHNIVRAKVQERAVPRTDLAHFNGELARTLAHAQIHTGTGNAFAWDWSDDVTLDRPLWPIARAGADLLTTANPERLHECAGETCGWLFLDTSKGGRRRWCSMTGCGNRAKVRRYRGRAD